MKQSRDRFITRFWKYWETHPKMVWLLSVIWVLLVSCLAFFWRLGDTGLVDETEPLFAEAARQITVTGDWITPYFNGETRFDKPVLIYWLMAIAYRILGVNEWAVRLPSAISALALTALGFYTLSYFGFPNPVVREQARGGAEELLSGGAEELLSGGAEEQGEGQGRVRWKDVPPSPFPFPLSPFPTPETCNPTPQSLWLGACIGAALIALNPITIAWARTGVSDMLLSGCMGTALLCFFLGYAQKGKNEGKSMKDETNNSFYPSPWYLAFYILSGLAVLTKGPVGAVLPILIIGSFLFYLGNWRQVLREMHLGWGCVIFGAIALPWYILCYLRNGRAFVDAFFTYHNIERFTQVVNNHSAPWYFYFLVVLVGFFPWSIYLPLAIARLHFWERKKWRASTRSSQLSLFALFWFFGVFGFFTIAVTKLPSYLLPSIPSAAILVALLFSEQLNFVSIYNSGIASQEQQKTNKYLFWSGIFNGVFCLVAAVILFYIPNIIGYDPAIPNLRQLLAKSGLAVWGFFIWAITAVAALVLLRSRRRLPLLVGVNLLGFVAFLIFVLSPASLLLDRSRQMPLRKLAATVDRVQQPQEELLMIGFKKPSLVFYTKRQVIYFDDFEKAFAYLEKTAALKRDRTSVLIVTQYNKLEGILFQRYRYQRLARNGAYQLLRLNIAEGRRQRAEGRRKKQ